MTRACAWLGLVFYCAACWLAAAALTGAAP